MLNRRKKSYLKYVRSIDNLGPVVKEELKAGDTVVIDECQISVPVEIGGELMFPWISFLCDTYDSKIVGYKITKKPDTQSTLALITKAIADKGTPRREVLIDNGKNYLPRKYRKNVGYNDALIEKFKLEVDIEVVRYELQPAGVEVHNVTRSYPKVSCAERFINKFRSGFIPYQIRYGNIKQEDFEKALDKYIEEHNKN